jgi:Family of unknown function (DUF6186)
VSSRDLTFAVWAALGLCVLCLGLLSAFRPRLVPTPRAAVGTIVSNRPGRIVLILGWMWLGWHLFAR